MTQYTPIPTSAAKFKNFAEMKHPNPESRFDFSRFFARFKLLIRFQVGSF